MLTLTHRPTVLPHRPAADTHSFLGGVMRAFKLRQSRRALAGLSAEQLADIGITREEADKEAARPLWDAPAHWRG